jgi:hypothetical protein
MGLRADTRYTGSVTRGNLIESGKGTPGFEILIECDEGSMVHTIWLTPATIDKGYAQKDFAVFDVTEEQLQSESFLRNQLPVAIVGKPVTFGTKEDEYKGEVKVKCAWIGKPKGPTAATLEGSVAAMFRGEKATAVKAPGDLSILDEDIPF